MKTYKVSHVTVSNWLDIFVRLYAIFRIPPFGSPNLRAVKKEQKHYHYDWTLVDNIKDYLTRDAIEVMPTLKFLQTLI